MNKFTFLFLLVLSSCATRYQPYNNFLTLTSGGYSDTQLAPDMFVIDFEGNSYSDMRTVHKYGLLRAAELAKGHGYEYFVIMSDCGFNKVDFSGGTNSLFVWNSPNISITIKAFKEKPSIENSFKVDDLLVELETVYEDQGGKPQNTSQNRCQLCGKRWLDCTHVR